MKLSKKVLSLLVALFFIFSICSITALAVDNAYSSDEEPDVVEFAGQISFDKEKLSLQDGGTYKLKVKVKPTDLEIPELTWTSSDEDVATVDSEGTVTAVGDGTAVITAETADGSASAKCTVTVKTVILVNSVKIPDDKLTVLTKQEKRLTAEVKPKNATNSTVKWTTSNKNIVTVDNTGKIKGVAKGKATITAAVGNVSDSVEVTVIEGVQLKSLAFPNKSVSLKVNNKITLIPTQKPDGATVAIKYTSSNTKVAQVDQKGVVTGLKAGNSKITVTDTITNISTEVTVRVTK